MLVLTFQVLVYVIFGTIVFILLPAIIFRFVEAEWTYLDSVYFAFITLTTIGFGDMVAGNLFPFYPRHCSTYYIDCLSKAARGRPEGPTERSVFKFFFVMLAIF